MDNSMPPFQPPQAIPLPVAQPLPPPVEPLPQIQEVRYVTRRVQTTERTGKFWKMWMLFGALFMLMGVASLVAGLATQQESLVILSIPILCIGFPIHAFGRIGAWWYHG